MHADKGEGLTPIKLRQQHLTFPYRHVIGVRANKLVLLQLVKQTGIVRRHGGDAALKQRGAQTLRNGFAHQIEPFALDKPFRAFFIQRERAALQ